MVVTAIFKSKYFTTSSVKQLTESLLAHDTRLNLGEDSMGQDFKPQISIGRARG